MQTVVTLKSADAEDEYTIAFHRCDESPMGVGSVTAEIDIVEVNPGPDYVGAGLVRTVSAPALFFPPHTPKRQYILCSCVEFHPPIPPSSPLFFLAIAHT